MRINFTDKVAPLIAATLMGDRKKYPPYWIEAKYSWASER
jgi:hypothetical protein